MSDTTAIVNEYGVKNIVPFPYISTFPRESAQVNFTCNKGKVTLNGTSGGIFTFVLVAKSSSVFDEASNALPIFMHDGTYIISNGTNVKIQMNIYRNGSKINTIICTDTEIQFDVLSTDMVEIGIPISMGEIFNNDTCYPMIRDARISDSTWVPYAMPNRELTEKKQNKLESKLITFERYFPANDTQVFTQSEILAQGNISSATPVLILIIAAQPKLSWTEIDAVPFYDVTTNKWAVYNRGTGGDCWFEFEVLYYN